MRHARRATAMAAAMACLTVTVRAQLDPPTNVRTLPRHLRVDVVWDGPRGSAYEIERATSAQGPFARLHDGPHRVPLYSDFLGTPDGEFHYRVRTVRPDGGGEPAEVSAWSPVVRGAPRQSTVSQLITEVQEAGVRYFDEGAHPESGLALEGIPRDPDLCASGATGMGLFNLAVGIERGCLTRDEGGARVLRIVRFLSQHADRFHGAFPHWLDGRTGQVIPFSPDDDGADLVETAYLAQGLLFAREYFNGGGAAETEIRELADTLWRDIEWDWFARRDERGAILLWHWSPRHEWKLNMPIRGFNECQIAYVLALASPTHPVPSEFYWSGWQHDAYGHSRVALGIPLQLGRDLGGPLFFTHYSYLGFDPRCIRYAGRSYFDHFRDLCRVQVLYAESRRDDFRGYGPLWGLTASYDPDGYRAHSPGADDNGTITPTAALASMPYVPEESLSCLVELYEHHGDRLWGEFGFRDALNLSRDWVADGYLGIDVGPIAPMIENQRTGLCWQTFMQAPEIAPVVERVAAGRP